MKRINWHLCLIVLVLGLLALALPGTAAAAPYQGSALSGLSGGLIVDAPVQPTFALPGVFSLKFGETAGSAEVDLPSINAVATVSGLSLSPQVGWDSLNLRQKQPQATTAGTISEAQVTVAGAAKGYTTEGTAQVKLAPSPALQASGKVGFRYDGLNKQTGFMLQNFDFAVAAGPANVAFKNMNTGANAISFDSAQVAVPAAGVTASVTGYAVKDGKADWKALSLAQDPKGKATLGNVGSLTQMQISVAGPSGGFATTASSAFTFDFGKAVHAEGKVYGIFNSPSKLNGMALSNASLAVNMPGLGLQMTGINSINSGVKIDTVSLSADPLSLDAEMKGVVVGGAAGFDFDQAKLTYTPSTANSLEVTLAKSPQGYVLTTTSVIPTARR